MSINEIPGSGRKRPQRNLKIKQLHLDPENPRLPEETQGQKEIEVLTVLYKGYNLYELAESMAKNGYFDEEPLVSIPNNLPKELQTIDPNSNDFQSFIDSEDTEFTVVEGNRRLATAKLLLDSDLQKELSIRNWPSISEEVREDLQELPSIIYPTRKEVIPYLGVRHIIGIQKWDSYAKARYIAKLMNNDIQIDKIEELIADNQGSIKKSYLAYRLLKQAREDLTYNTKKAENEFSYLLLAIGQRPIKQFLGLPTRIADTNFQDPISTENLKNFHNLLLWIYGDQKVRPVIRESRDITTYLSHIVGNPKAVSHLESTGNLQESYDRSDGEESMLMKYLKTANSKLESALGIAHRHRTIDVISEVEKCNETAERLLKSVKEDN